MVKHNAKAYWKRCAALGVMLIGVGIYISYKPTDGSMLREGLKAICSIACMLVGIMQFRLSYVFYKQSHEKCE